MRREKKKEKDNVILLTFTTTLESILAFIQNVSIFKICTLYFNMISKLRYISLFIIIEILFFLTKRLKIFIFCSKNLFKSNLFLKYSKILINTLFHKSQIRIMKQENSSFFPLKKKQKMYVGKNT